MVQQQVTSLWRLAVSSFGRCLLPTDLLDSRGGLQKTSEHSCMLGNHAPLRVSAPAMAEHEQVRRLVAEPQDLHS